MLFLLCSSSAMASSINNNHLTLSTNLLLIIILLFLFTRITCASSSSSSSNIHHNQIQRGFTVTPHSSLNFQSILTDPTSTFSFGFLRINSTLLDLAILHLQSSFPLWRAVPNRPVSWSSSTSLSFNGTLLLSHSETDISWTTNTTINGDALVLLNSSNLQIVKDRQVLWQSFDFPSDTILDNQNFTSKAALFSANQRFSMSLGPTYLALYMEHLGRGSARPMYWKRTALQAKAEIVLGGGPIYARLDPTGFLGLYQNETALVDVLSFDTFNSGIKKSLRRLTLESDGNLKSYYWSGSGWVSDFEAIIDNCELPTYCGAYGMCNMEGQQCVGCVDNSSTAGSCFPADSGDLCGSDVDKFQVVRSGGVDLMNKELLGFQKVGSLQECEGLCESNCSCWGAVYNNVSGYCYRMDYPIQTLLAVDDERKLGYFKVRNTEEKGGEKRKTAGLVLIIVGALVLAGGIGFAGYRVWNARRWSSSSSEDEVGMPYKDLNSSSFRSIEMSNSFRK